MKGKDGPLSRKASLWGTERGGELGEVELEDRQEINSMFSISKSMSCKILCKK